MVRDGTEDVMVVSGMREGWGLQWNRSLATVFGRVEYSQTHADSAPKHTA